MEDGGPNPYYRPGNNYGKRIMQQSRADSLMFTVYPFYGKVDVGKARIIRSIGMTTPSRISPMESR
jgi:hypothetical protein